MARAPGIRVRRARHLVCYWRSGSFVVHNYATGILVAVSPLVQELLDSCTDWCPLSEISQTLRSSRLDGPSSTAGVRALLERLLVLTILERRGVRPDPRVAAMSTLDRWNPAAGFFHTATKHVRFIPAREAELILRRQAREWPMPRPVKRLRGAASLPLPAPDTSGEFARVLLARRTWRRFSRQSVSRGQLATALGLSVGVQAWIPTATGDVPLKTSPSGGARHPIECYVAVRQVAGVPPGLYHYAADVHRLERIRRGDLTRRLGAWMPHSGFFARAAFTVIFTAVFERQLWRYPYARAYRAALVEAGHVCQTFCLTATWLGLAPFCLMGLADREIERDLGIDGISESALYAAGAGVPPRGVAWAPLSRGTLSARPNPRLRPRR